MFDDVTESLMSVFKFIILPGVATIDSAGSDLANLMCFFCLKWLKRTKNVKRNNVYRRLKDSKREKRKHKMVFHLFYVCILAA